MFFFVFFLFFVFLLFFFAVDYTNLLCFQYCMRRNMQPRATRLCIRVYLGSIWVDLEGQGRRSKVRVIWCNFVIRRFWIVAFHATCSYCSY